MNNSFKSVLLGTMATLGLAKHSRQVFNTKPERKAPDDVGGEKGKSTGRQRRSHNAERHAGQGDFGKHFLRTTTEHGKRQVGFVRIVKKDGTFSRMGLAMQDFVTVSKLHATKGWRSKTYAGATKAI